jgi:hypothetical protein
LRASPSRTTRPSAPATCWCSWTIATTGGALPSAEGAVAAAGASLANLDATRRLQAAVVDQARADVAADAAESERARADAELYRVLARSEHSPCAGRPAGGSGCKFGTLKI